MVRERTERAAANAGQSIQTSSEAMKQYQEVQRQWAEAKANLWGELDYKATQDAINIHRWSLEQSIQLDSLMLLQQWSWRR